VSGSEGAVIRDGVVQRAFLMQDEAHRSRECLLTAINATSALEANEVADAALAAAPGALVTECNKAVPGQV